MMKILGFVIAITSLVGCATSYQPQSFSGGFNETQLDKNIFRVSFKGNVFLTVLSGVATYTLGQILLKFFLEPIQEVRKTIGLIAHALVEKANVIHNPGVPTEEMMNDASTQLRSLSSQLLSHLYLVPFYDVTRKIFLLPERTHMEASSQALIGLSNSVFRSSSDVYSTNESRVKLIRDSLGISGQ